MPGASVDEIGRQLAAARAAGRLLDPSVLPPPEGEAAAYALQRAATDALDTDLAGWKIGATSPETRARLGIAAPFFGPIPAADAHPSGATIPLAPGARGVEIELAFRLARDLPRRLEPYALAEVAAAVDSLHPAIEVVGQRTRLEGPPKGLIAIADFGFNVAFVHEAAIPGWERLDLPTVEAACLVDGAERARGTAAVVLGSPLEALRWLADHGPGLRAGQWVSTGTLTGITPVAAGSRVVGDFGRLGRVELGFA